MLSFEYGTIALVASGELLGRICFTSSPDEALSEVCMYCPDAGRGSQPLFDEVFSQLQEYFRGDRKTFDVRLDDTGLSEFAREVHNALRDVPYGSVISYRDLARSAGSVGAARAVGRVMSTNPFPLIVPCHRVVNADGRLGQYSGGTGKETKARLIAFERGLGPYLGGFRASDYSRS
jgi:methylated-DNA-[protein]-cysteine S-methyltransferase